TSQPPREVERVGRGYRIAVHYAKRIAALDDVDARQRAPGASDRIKRAAAAALELGQIGQFVPDDTLGALERFVRQVLQGKGAKRQRDTAADTVAAHIDQLERAAAEIADDAIRLVNA